MQNSFVLFFISETIRSERRRLYGTSTVVMNVDKVIFPGLTNGTRLYSPITLSKEWSTLGRLVAMVFAAMFGAVMNVYFISSFTVQVSLRKKGYIYYCCLGLADVLVTCCVIPMSAVVLLSGVWDIYPVCQVLQTLTAASTYSYSILSTMVAAENYFTVKGYGSDCTCNKYLIGASAFLVFPFSLALAIYGTYWHQDYDYCGRRRLMEYYNAARAPIAPEVRTHIMQQAVNPNSPQRASSSTRETLEL
ncbi:hypothetical protein PYW08_000505 [Mythimna loreyi]|uniref:Uncharacterized protein n=1 Tax=Mythimna loreyi TaxID=667449 RepID=A0ACC2RCN4_9NEOP|nr:hypothetical protein PYW08_000505 [Mythimna loreyi]